MNKKILCLIIAAMALTTLSPEIAMAARDLSSATTSAVNEATNIAKGASLLGILAGAITFQIPGAAHFAQRLFTGGIIGAALAFGGPSLLNLLRSIFGG